MRQVQHVELWEVPEILINGPCKLIVIQLKRLKILHQGDGSLDTARQPEVAQQNVVSLCTSHKQGGLSNCATNKVQGCLQGPHEAMTAFKGIGRGMMRYLNLAVEVVCSLTLAAASVVHALQQTAFPQSCGLQALNVSILRVSTLRRLLRMLRSILICCYANRCNCSGASLCPAPVVA